MWEKQKCSAGKKRGKIMSRTFVSGSSSTRARSRGSRGRSTASAQGASSQNEHLRDQSQLSSARSDPWDGEGETCYGPRVGVHDNVCTTEGDQASATEERRLQRQSGYYVQHPKPSHNQKLKSMAQEETIAYNEHKAEKRAHIAEQTRQLQPQVLGGASVSSGELQELRVRQEREQKINAKYASIQQKQKRDEYIQAKRMREDRELEEKKRKQREKAVLLEHKQATEEVTRKEEMKRARLARFT